MAAPKQTQALYSSVLSVDSGTAEGVEHAGEEEAVVEFGADEVGCGGEDVEAGRGL